MSESSKKLLQAAAGAAGGEALAIEDVFSTYLYTGNGTSQTITNGIDLAGEGGLVWIKSRTAGRGHSLFDTARGATRLLCSNESTAQDGDFGGVPQTDTLTSFNAGGFSLGADANYAWVNSVSGGAHASWTFRKAPKFFDVVTYTGDGAASRNIAHNLGSVPGCIIGKGLSISDNWGVYHRSTGANGLYLNGTNSAGVTGVLTGQTSTTFEVGNGYGINNSSGVTYVAYLFAHNAGGFGDAGADNVISCGSFTTDGSGTATVNLGWEPQWILAKRSDNVQDWKIIDTMRGFAIPSSSDATLYPNASSAEGAGSDWGAPTATGFTADSQPSSANFIYIAIRRGPMRAPTSGTEVFAASTAAAGTLFATGITSLDAAFIVNRTVNGGARSFFSRLAASRGLDPTSTAAEGNYGTAISWDLNNAFYQSAIGSAVQWLFRRAPGFFDVVCYTGTGSARTVTHNLGVAPEMMIVKARDAAEPWLVYHSALTATSYLNLNTDGTGGSTIIAWNNTEPTSSVFTLGVWNNVNGSGTNYIAYLFATLAGVSKVGSYTGTGTTLSID